MVVVEFDNNFTIYTMNNGELWTESDMSVCCSMLQILNTLMMSPNQTAHY